MKYSFLFIVIVALGAGCSQETDTAGKEPGNDSTKIVITGEPGLDYTITLKNNFDLSDSIVVEGITDTSGVTTVGLKFTSPKFLQVQTALSSNRIIAAPGAVVEMSIDDDPTTFSGPLASANQYLLRLQESEERFYTGVPYYELEPGAFIERYDSVKADMEVHKNDLKNTDIDDENVLKLLLDLADAKLLFMKKAYILPNRQKIGTLDDNTFFISALGEITMNDDLLSAHAWEHTTNLRLMLEEELIFQLWKENDAKGDLTLWEEDQVQMDDGSALTVAQRITDLELSDDVTEFLRAKNFQYWIYVMGIRPEIEQIYSDFTGNYSGSGYLDDVNELYDSWKRLTIGQPAPQITATTINDEPFNLSALKGKPVYINVWATWCDPCISDFKYYEDLRSSFGNEVQFLFISVDQDRGSWADFIKSERAPEGIHVIEGLDDIDNDIWEKYLLKAVGRHILIDSNGNIIEAVAPGPSSKELQEMFIKATSGAQSA